MAEDSKPIAKRPRIDGLYELGHVFYLLDADAHGYGRADVALVEYFWTFGDMHSSWAGFVLALHDGRRAHVDFLHWHGFEQDEDLRIEVAFLAGSQPPPSPSSSQHPTGVWSLDAAHLNRMLSG